MMKARTLRLATLVAALAAPAGCERPTEPADECAPPGVPLDGCELPTDPQAPTHSYSAIVQRVTEDFRLAAFSPRGDLVGTRGTGAETRGVRIRDGVETSLADCLPVAISVQGDIACGGRLGAVIDRNGSRIELTPDSMLIAEVGGIDDDGRVFGTFFTTDWASGYFHGSPGSLQFEPAWFSWSPIVIQANARSAGLIQGSASSGSPTPYWFADSARVVSVYGAVPIFLNGRNDILGTPAATAAPVWWGDAPTDNGYPGSIFPVAVPLPGDCTPFAITDSRQFLGKAAGGERCIIDTTGKSRRVGAGLHPDSLSGWQITWDGPTNRYHAAGYLAVDARSGIWRGIAIIRVE